MQTISKVTVCFWVADQLKITKGTCVRRLTENFFENSDVKKIFCEHIEKKKEKEATSYSRYIMLAGQIHGLFHIPQVAIMLIFLIFAKHN